jgi:hypothetical protein
MNLNSMKNANYPEKTCDVDRLIRNRKSIIAARNGDKTEQRRDGIYAYPDEVFELEGEPYAVTDLTWQSLGQMTDADARAEGYSDLETYKELILRMHKGMEWEESHLVWVHKFKKSN